MTRIRAVVVMVFTVATLGSSSVLRAASYVPMSDAELAAGASVIVRAEVVSRAAALETIRDRDVVFTDVTLRALEVFKGTPRETLVLRIPGGRVGEAVTWIAGTPAFSPGQEVVLFLEEHAPRPGVYRLSEFALSKFDLVTDGSGRGFAVRPVFSPEADLVVSARSGPEPRAPSAKSQPPARDAESFLAALRALRRGDPLPEVRLAPMQEGTGASVRRKWVNILGEEPGSPFYCDRPCLFRWFWDEVSPPANVAVAGQQTNLVDDEPTCGIDSLCHVDRAVAGWHDVAETDVRMELASAAPVHLQLDAVRDPLDGSIWDTPAGCGPGIAAVTITWGSYPPRPFKGDLYLFISSADTAVRKHECSTGLRARDFGSIVIHELGHALGLGHSDQGTSMHSSTTPEDWGNAVMFSSRPLSEPLTPQTDDIQAIQYYYGTSPPGPAPVADFTHEPAAPVARETVRFFDASTGAPIAWYWELGDPYLGGVISRERNPEVRFLSPGIYAIRLLAFNSEGTGELLRNLEVPWGGPAPCVPDAATLCLNGGRFEAIAEWGSLDGGGGQATAVPLTADAGYFWFFDAANVEVVVKVLEACEDPFDSYWVFAAGLTNLGVRLIVTDMQTGAVKVYSNPTGTAFAPVQDTSAFSTCP